METRWLRRLGPAALALAVAGIVATGSPGAAGQSRPLPLCGGVRPIGAAESVDRTAGLPATWSQLDPQLDDRGVLEGQQLGLGVFGGATWRLDLPPESFATGPVGGLVVVGEDDGRASRLRLVDAVTGCSVEIGREASVVRSAVLDPSSGAVYEHRVERSSRSDLGIWRRPTQGGPERRVMAPFAADPEIGVVWTTALFWSADGGRLVVASCGAGSCRHRLLDPATGATEIVAGSPTGDPIGATGETVVAFEACGPLPCPIVEIDVASGASRRLVDAAGPAIVASVGGRPELVFETPDGSGIVAFGLGSGPSMAAAIPAGRALLAPPWLSGGSVETGVGRAALVDPRRPAADPERLTMISIDPTAGEGSR